MNKSLMYGFLLNMWKSKRVMEEFLTVQKEKGFITQDELEEILATPQN